MRADYVGAGNADPNALLIARIEENKGNLGTIKDLRNVLPLVRGIIREG